MYNDYYIRVKQADKQQLYQLSELLGILSQQKDFEGNLIPDYYHVAQAYQGHWDTIGNVYKPTGEMTEMVSPNGTTISVPEIAPVLDEEGVPYWHANLRINANLAEIAAEKAQTNPEIATQLQNLNRWFIVDSEGKATKPKNPSRIFL